ncbi:MAG: signal peptidase II [Melioribacteraceae bacterium]
MKVLYTTVIVVIIDQVTKFLVKGGTIPFLNIKANGMEYGQSINVIGDFFKITFVENPGLAFGIDVNNSSKLILSIFSLLASIGIFYYLYKSRDKKFIVRFALALILGGAIGNLIDRAFYGLFYGYAPLFYGRVVDFFNVDFFDFTIFGRTYDRWPIFNIADASVSIGVVLLIIFHKSAEETASEENDLLVTKESVVNENLELESSNPIVKNVEDNNREEN